MPSGAKIGLGCAALLLVVVLGALAAYAVFRASSVVSEESARWAAADAAGDVASLESYIDWSYEMSEGGFVSAWALAHASAGEEHRADAEARVDLGRARQLLASGDAVGVCGAVVAHPELAEVGPATAALSTRASAAVDRYVVTASALGAHADAIETVALGLRRASRAPCAHAPLVVSTLTIAEWSGLDGALAGSTETASRVLDLDGGLSRQSEALRTSLDRALAFASGDALGYGPERVLVVEVSAAIGAASEPFEVEDGTQFPGLSMEVTLSVRAPLPASLGSAWTGSYTCAQGMTALALEVEPLDVGRARARFDFSTYPGGSPLPEGGFLLSGTLDVASGVLSLHPDRWIAQPDPDWTMVPLTAVLDRAAGTASGRIEDPSCGALTLTRAADPRGRALVRTAHLELPAGYASTITVADTDRGGFTDRSYPWMSMYSDMLSSLMARLAAFVRHELGLVEPPAAR